MPESFGRQFSLYFPVYCLVTSDSILSTEDPTADVQFAEQVQFIIGEADEGRFLPIFTDRPLAEDYVREAGREGTIVIFPVSDRGELKQLLDQMGAEITMLIFDPPVQGSVAGRVIPMGYARRQLMQ